MNHKLLAICALTALAAGLTGCNESVDNGIDCSDGVKKFQCADSKYYSYCDPVTKTEKVGVCDGGFVCSEEVGNPDAPCVDPNALKPESCTNGDLKCDGSFVSRCINQAWIKDDVACQYGCDNGKCNDKPADGCKDGAKQCKGSIPQTCSNGSWTDGTNCEYGCENGECKPAPTCNVGDKQCNENNTNVQTCTASGWVDETPSCNYGCENGQCKEPPVEPDCTEEGAKQCADATVQTCTDGQWKNADSACEYGCDKGECKPAPACGDGNVDEGEDCDGGVPEGKTCGDVQPMATGTLACDPTTCKFTGCALPEEGSECDPDTFIESCDGTKVVWCDEGEVVNGGYDCASVPGAACVVLDVPGNNNTVVKYADCMNESLRCATPNTQYNGCGTKSDYDYVGQFVCLPGSDGHNYGLEITQNETAVWCGDGEFEDAPSCIPETGQCGKLVDDEGDECTASYEPKCDGNFMVNCSSGVVDADDCGAKSCVVITADLDDGRTAVQAMCMAESDACTTVGESSLECYSGYSVTNLCAAGDKGQNYKVMVDYEECIHECDNATGACIKLIDNEGEKCDPADFEPSCTESGVVVTCNPVDIDFSTFEFIYAVTATQCGEGTTCKTYADSKGNLSAACLTTCTEKDKDSYVCDGNKYSDHFVCTEINGALYNVNEGSTCSHGCDTATGECIKLSEREGTECDSETERYACDGTNVILNCSDNVWKAYTCGDGVIEGSKCVDLGGDYGEMCYLPCTKSADPEAEVAVCNNDSYYGTRSWKGLCVSASDNSGDYLVRKSSEACSHGCDDTAGVCTKLVDNEGEACPADFAPSCTEQGIAVTCSSNKVRAEECKSGTACHVTDTTATCFETCSNPGTSSAVCALNSWGYAVLTTTACLQDEVGNYSVVTSVYCNNGCNTAKDGCLILSDKEGTACEYGTDKRICDGTGVILQCSSSNTWAAFSCESAVGAGTECADMGATKGAFCYEPCSTVSEEKTVCEVEEDWDYGDTYYSVSYVCTANVDGTANYYMEKGYEYCGSDACSAETGLCPVPTYDPCDSTCKVSADVTCAEYCVSKYGEGTACTTKGTIIKCGAPCTAEDTDTFVCEYYIGTELEGDIDSYEAHCTELSDGTYMWIRADAYYEKCAPGTCTDGVGCDE